MNKTVLGIIREKSIEALEKTSLEKIKRQMIKFLIACFGSLLVSDGGIELLKTLVSWNSYMPLKVSGVFTLVYSWEYLKNAYKADLRDKYIQRIEGVEISKVEAFIFEKGGFPVQEARTLGLSKQSIEIIGKGLESVGIFERGANNARVLNESFTRSDLLSVLAHYSSTGEWFYLRKDDGGYSHSPAPNFSKKII